MQIIPPTARTFVPPYHCGNTESASQTRLPLTASAATCRGERGPVLHFYTNTCSCRTETYRFHCAQGGLILGNGNQQSLIVSNHFQSSTVPSVDMGELVAAGSLRRRRVAVAPPFSTLYSAGLGKNARRARLARIFMCSECISYSRIIWKKGGLRVEGLRAPHPLSVIEWARVLVCFV
jgi:hypothetical protein